jgi:hypothetical protein
MVYRESGFSISLDKFAKNLTLSYLSVSDWFNQEDNNQKKIKLFQVHGTYFKVLDHVYA